MKVNRLELLDKVKKINSITSNNPILQGDCVIFKDEFIWGYTNEMFIRVPGFDIHGAVHGKTLESILNKIKQEEVEIDQDDDQFVIQHGKKSKATIKYESEIQAPIDDLPLPEYDWKDLPNEFNDALDSVLFCAGTGDYEADAIRNSIHIDEGKIETSDGSRMFQRYLEGECSQMLLPVNSMKVLKRYEPVQYISEEDKGWSFFINNDQVLIGCRQLEASYPDMSKLIPEDYTEIVFPEGLLETVELAKTVLADRGNNIYCITCSISNNSMNVKAEGSYGKIDEELELPESVDYELAFSINPDYFIPAIKMSNDAKCTDKVIVVDGENSTYVACFMTK